MAAGSPRARDRKGLRGRYRNVDASFSSADRCRRATPQNVDVTSAPDEASRCRPSGPRRRPRPRCSSPRWGPFASGTSACSPSRHVLGAACGRDGHEAGVTGDWLGPPVSVIAPRSVDGFSEAATMADGLHEFPDGFFARTDEADDREFYSVPRFVTHIDDRAIAAVGLLYEELRITGSILDLMSSWVSHFKETPA